MKLKQGKPIKMAKFCEDLPPPFSSKFNILAYITYSFLTIKGAFYRGYASPKTALFLKF
jgi:hypothetical protein